MTHVQIADDFLDHPKVLRVGKDAKILAFAAILYSGNMLTDGFVPGGMVAVLGAKTGVTKTKQAADELVAARLWEVTEGGYQVHDYLDYNASAEKVRAKQAAARARMQRLRSPDVRANNERTSREVRDTTTTTTSSLEPNGSQELGLGDSPPPPPPDEPQKENRKHRLPDGWEPTANQREALAADGFSTAEIDAELVKFARHYHHKGETGLRWDLSFANWMAKSREFNRKPNLAVVNGMPPEIAALPWNNAKRMKWENDHREIAS